MQQPSDELTAHSRDDATGHEAVVQQYAAAQGWKSVRVSELQRWSKGVEGAVNG